MITICNYTYINILMKITSNVFQNISTINITLYKCKFIINIQIYYTQGSKARSWKLPVRFINLPAGNLQETSDSGIIYFKLFTNICIITLFSFLY